MELIDALEDYRLYLSVVQRKAKKTQKSFPVDVRGQSPFFK